MIDEGRECRETPITVSLNPLYGVLIYYLSKVVRAWVKRFEYFVQYNKE